MGYLAYDDPGEVDDILARRDWFPGDWVEINIDSHYDKRTAFVRCTTDRRGPWRGSSGIDPGPGSS